MACLTACPSGVKYDRLIEATRPQVERHGRRSFMDRAFRRLIFEIFPHPSRLRALAWPLWLYQRSGLRSLIHASGLLTMLPARLAAMERLLPDLSASTLRIARRAPARRRRVTPRGRIAPRMRAARVLSARQRRDRARPRGRRLRRRDAGRAGLLRRADAACRPGR
jgi:glycolate oxidase iron-sulfur subunit